MFPVADDERDRVDRRHRLGERAEETPERALLGLDGEEPLEATGERRSSARVILQRLGRRASSGIAGHRGGRPPLREPPPRRARRRGAWRCCGPVDSMWDALRARSRAGIVTGSPSRRAAAPYPLRPILFLEARE